METGKCCVLIPSLSPDEKLPAYVQELLSGGFGGVVVVDDGSSEEYQPIFDRIAGWEGCHVEHHGVNRGKGAALKTGYAYITEKTGFEGVVTADSDGQHTLQDTLHLAALLSPDREEVLLGSRDFSRGSLQVPPKSRAGNRITSVVFRLLYGPSLPDTQTGLRAFNRAMLPMMRRVEGERFEYEMNVLIRCAVEHVPMTPVPIQTVYHDENKGTHFHPIRDSWRIYKLLLGGFFRFMSASVIATVVDFVLFTLLNRQVVPRLWPHPIVLSALGSDVRMLFSTYGARAVSALINFKLNKSFVFKLKKCRGAVVRYVLLCVAVALVSGLAVGTLTQLFPRVSKTVLKMPVDLILFLVNYRIQRGWVFRENAQEEKEKETAEQ